MLSGKTKQNRLNVTQYSDRHICELRYSNTPMLAPEKGAVWSMKCKEQRIKNIERELLAVALTIGCEYYHVMEIEVKEALRHISNRKSAGRDGIPIELLKAGGEEAVSQSYQ